LLWSRRGTLTVNALGDLVLQATDFGFCCGEHGRQQVVAFCIELTAGDSSTIDRKTE